MRCLQERVDNVLAERAGHPRRYEFTPTSGLVRVGGREVEARREDGEALYAALAGGGRDRTGLRSVGTRAKVAAKLSGRASQADET